MLTRKSLTQETVRMQSLTEHTAHSPCSKDSSEPWAGANSIQQTSSSDYSLKGPVQGNSNSVQSLSRVQLFVTPWTVAHLAPLSLEFS